MKHTINTRYVMLAGVIFAASFQCSASAASKSWSKSGGTSSKAAYTLDANASASASASSAYARGSASARVAFLGSSYMTIASASAQATGTKTSLSADSSVKFLGGTIWATSKSGSLTSFSASLPYLSKTWKPPVSPTYMVGPVPVKLTPSVSVGMSGSISANVNPYSLTFSGSLYPISIDCGAGVSASVANDWVRVNGSVTMCKLAPNITSSCSWKYRTARYDAGLSYGTLGGSINLVAGKGWLQYSLKLMELPGFSGRESFFAQSASF